MIPYQVAKPGKRKQINPADSEDNTVTVNREI